MMKSNTQWEVSPEQIADYEKAENAILFEMLKAVKSTRYYRYKLLKKGMRIVNRNEGLNCFQLWVADAINERSPKALSKAIRDYELNRQSS